MRLLRGCAARRKSSLLLWVPRPWMSSARYTATTPSHSSTLSRGWSSSRADTRREISDDTPADTRGDVWPQGCTVYCWRRCLLKATLLKRCHDGVICLSFSFLPRGHEEPILEHHLALCTNTDWLLWSASAFTSPFSHATDAHMFDAAPIKKRRKKSQIIFSYVISRRANLKPAAKVVGFFLPSGRGHGSLREQRQHLVGFLPLSFTSRCMRSRSNRFKNSFFLDAVWLLTEKWVWVWSNLTYDIGS